MKKYYLAIIVVGVVSFGAGCGKQDAKTTQTNTSTQSTTNVKGNNTGTFTTNENTNSLDTKSSTVTLTITSSGMSNKSLTVPAGTVITFVNNDSTAHQIASNPHPSHTDLPGFDLNIPVGSSRSFTFMKVGSWGYHDHDDPFASEFQGKIIVQ